MTPALRVAAVIALVVIGSAAAIVSGPGGSGFGGTNPTPSPRPPLLARGNFVTSVGEVVELDATREGSSVTGRMTVSAQGEIEPYTFTVDLQCARATDDGLIMIGGVTTNSTGRGSRTTKGAWTGIVLERESPVGASIWYLGVESRAADCLELLDEQLVWEGSRLPAPDGFIDPIEGTVEFGPSR